MLPAGIVGWAAPVAALVSVTAAAVVAFVFAIAVIRNAVLLLTVLLETVMLANDEARLLKGFVETRAWRVRSRLIGPVPSESSPRVMRRLRPLSLSRLLVVLDNTRAKREFSLCVCPIAVVDDEGTQRHFQTGVSAILLSVKDRS